MSKIIKKILGGSLLTLVFFGLSTQISYAVCPICTIAVGAGLGLSRYFGIDDLVSGVWLGGFLTSFSFMTANWLYKKEYFKKINKNYLNFVSFALYILLTFIPLHFAGITGHPYNKIGGIDKLLIGSFVGTLVFLGSIYLDQEIRKVKGKQLFNYQKVAIPVTLLAIISLIFYFITR